MAQIIVWRRDGKQPCFNNIHPKDFFVFVDGGIKVKTGFDLPHSRLQYASKRVNLQPSAYTELVSTEGEFHQRQGAERFVRGKWMLWFLVEFALEIHRIMGSPKVKISIGPGNAMIVIAPRVRCPESLQMFLERTYGQYIREKR
ncbi:hypothetical protein VU05_01230 [Desulfobulbus sp. F1]|nr:hypothetical protein [Desulfobulbus sp. F1]